MRSKSLSGVLLGLIISAIGAGVQVGAQSTNDNVLIFGFDHFWKMNQQATDLGTAWRAPAYDDSVAGWEGEYSGIFGFPSDEVIPFGGGFLNTQLNQNNNGRFTTNYYFRTKFVFTNSTTSNVVLVASNILDDGAVFYLNGVEVGRIGMPAGTINHTTFANRALESLDTGIEVFYISPQNLLLGTNVLAVELHQGGAGSSDAIFGMALSWFRGTRPAITNQPTSTIVPCAGKPAVMSVAAIGDPPVTYRWFTNNVLLANQVGSVLNLPQTTTNMNGARVTVSVSNILGVVLSTNTAILSVFPDQCGPRALVAESLDTLRLTNQVEISFDEFIHSGSRLTNNFQIVQLNNTNASLRITNVAVGAGPNVRLTVNTNLYRTNHYLITINNVRDNISTTLSLANVIAPNTQIPVGFKTTNTIFGVGSVGWRYNPVEFDASIGNSWTNINYIDHPDTNFSWADGIAPFVRDPLPGGSRCFPQDGSTMDVNRAIYFRKTFLVPTNLVLSPRVELNLRYNADDGVVFYLNGLELTRPNMPGGLINYFTPPSVGVEHSCTTFTRDIDSDLIRRGTNRNVLAAELHQLPADPAGDTDMVFDAGLAFVNFDARPLRTNRGRLNIIRQGTNLVLWWPTNGISTNAFATNNGYILEATDHVTTNLWREVQPNMANPMTNAMNTARRFYRLRWDAP